MNKSIQNKINKLAIKITGYGIVSIEDYDTAEEAIKDHLDWLEMHFVDIRQTFESETRKFIE